MNTHQNARLTVWGRAEAVRRLVEDGEPVVLVAAALHVSVRTPYKWRQRFLVEGPAGLLDRSSRPHHSPRRTTGRLVRRIIHLRTTQRLTGPEIAAGLQLPVATVGRLLQHAGLGRLKQPGSDRLRPRYQREQPGELLHVDLKALPRFVAVGHRIHGNPSKAHRRRGVGADYLHVAVDDATRLAHAEVLPAQDGPTCAAFLTRTLSWFAGLGISVERVMTDNAFAYTGRAMGTALAAGGIRHLRPRPYSPQTNGKAERFIQTCLRGWAYNAPIGRPPPAPRPSPPFWTSITRRVIIPRWGTCPRCFTSSAGPQEQRHEKRQLGGAAGAKKSH